MNQIGQETFRVKVTITEYLRLLRKQEAAKPLLERRWVPSSIDIAAAAGMSLSGYYKWSGNRAGGINRQMTGAALWLLRSRGFETTFDDIFELE